MAAQDTNSAVRKLGDRATLDNTNLKRIEQNPFILRDGTLPVCGLDLYLYFAFISIGFLFFVCFNNDDDPTQSDGNRVTRSHLNVLETKPKRKRNRKNSNPQVNLRRVHSPKEKQNESETAQTSLETIEQNRMFIDEELDELEAKMDAQFASLLRVYETMM